MVKRISLTDKEFTTVDDEDYEVLKQTNWCLSISDGIKYAVGYKYLGFYKYTNESLHRVIMKAKKGQYVDHINGNGLDNRRCNLRIVTNSENLRNRGPQKNNKCGYKGVYFETSRNKWRAKIKIHRKCIELGRFDTAKQAAQAYNDAAIKYHGVFARLNDL